MDGFLQILCLSCPKVTGNYYSGSNGDSIKKSYQKKNKTSGGTDSGQGIAAQKISYDQRISSIVKLLKKIAQKIGMAKAVILFQIGPSVRSVFEEVALICKTSLVY